MSFRVAGWPQQTSGQGIGSWLAFHEFEPSTTKVCPVGYQCPKIARFVAKNPLVAEQCEDNIHSLTHSASIDLGVLSASGPSGPVVSEVGLSPDATKDYRN
ncbi:hypothetical protein TNCV_1902671 [Trichonephila clavipes]|nr:hypothetical protein TNCV_1902671 [Trichonephila clavipes]